MLLSPLPLERDRLQTETAAAPETSEAPAVVYTCPMHPSVRMPAPGQCPICG
jgi:Cu+-exporting ATPase